MRFTYQLLRFLIVFYPLFPVLADNTDDFVTITLSASPTTKLALYPVFKKFTNETGIEVRIMKFSKHSDLKNNNDYWLSLSGNHAPDILYTHSSTEFLTQASEGKVHSLNRLWLTYGLTNQFSNDLISKVSLNGTKYALPYSYKTWGIFYQQNLIDQFGPIPQSWNEFVEYCVKIKNAGLAVFPASQNQPYILSAWLEYLILRMHGIATFHEFMHGKISFFDERIQEAFKLWKKLIDKGLFAKEEFNGRWQDFFPLFLRNKLAFLFITNTAQRRILSNSHNARLKYMSFPKINDIEQYETAPIESLFINAKSQRIPQAEKLLAFLARADVQSQIARRLFAFPANTQSQIARNKIVEKSHSIFKSASGITSFFNRSADVEYRQKVLMGLSNFIKSADVDSTLYYLEKVRLALYTN